MKLVFFSLLNIILPNSALLHEKLICDSTAVSSAAALTNAGLSHFFFFPTFVLRQGTPDKLMFPSE